MTTAPSVASIVPISLGGSLVRGGLNDHIGGVFYSLGVMDHTCVGTVDLESHLGMGTHSETSSWGHWKKPAGCKVR